MTKSKNIYRILKDTFNLHVHDVIMMSQPFGQGRAVASAIECWEVSRVCGHFSPAAKSNVCNVNAVNGLGQWRNY